MGKGGVTNKMMRVYNDPIEPENFIGLNAALKPMQAVILAICPQSAVSFDRLARANHPPEALKYNRENVLVVLRMVALGLPQSGAAAAIGVDPNRISEWKAKYPDFQLALDRATVINQESLLSAVYAGIDKNPKLALELLDRRHPKDFGQTKRVEANGVISHAHSAVGVLAQLQGERKKLDSATLTESQSIGCGFKSLPGYQFSFFFNHLCHSKRFFYETSGTEL
jgi:hypothetical protein